MNLVVVDTYKRVRRDVYLTSTKCDFCPRSVKRRKYKPVTLNCYCDYTPSYDSACIYW